MRLFIAISASCASLCCANSTNAYRSLPACRQPTYHHTQSITNQFFIISCHTTTNTKAFYMVTAVHRHRHDTSATVITFCVSRRRRKMYCGHARLCVCLSTAVCPHYCTDSDVTWRHGRGCPLVVHYWADLQSVHRLRCYGNISRTLVYAGCARVAD